MGESGQRPYEGVLPREEDLAQLPRRAQLAFAARCAERVMPLFSYYWPAAESDSSDAIHIAVSVVKRVAASPVSIYSEVVDILIQAAATLRSAADAVDAERLPSIAKHVARVVAYAADAAAKVSPKGYSPLIARVAHAASATMPEVVQEMRRDYELLKALAEREGWTDESPVDPDLLGPLWADGEPEGWPVGREEHKFASTDVYSEGSSGIAVTVRRNQMDIPRIDLWIDPGDATSDDIAELFSALSDLQRALGGEGLVFNKAGGKDLVVRGVKR